MLLALLRIVLVLHTVALFAQAGLAGEFLSGTDGVVKFHEWTAWAILAICTIQIITAAVVQRTGGASLWLLIASVLVFLGEALQTGTGYGRFLRVHLPLGVVLFGAVTCQAIGQFRSGSKP
jgi:hypothetical protein